MDLKHESQPLPEKQVTVIEVEPNLGSAASTAKPHQMAADEPDNDFLSSFMAGSDFDVQAQEAQPAATIEIETTPEQDISIRPLLASRDLKQAFPVQEPREALTLASMPHYDLGAQGSVRMGHLEMRWLMADSTVTIENESGMTVSAGRDLCAETDKGIQSLVDGGYIRAVSLTVEERRAVAQINEVLREDLPTGWEALNSGVNPSIAYELTDAGIAAGRSVRNWDGNSADAGLVRLPEGQPMPKIVASDVYDLSAAVMENRSLAGVLKPGEMGAYLQAEMSSIDYGRQNGTDPVVTLGRLDGVVDMSTVMALDQIQNGQSGPNVPLRTEDIARLVQQARRTLDALPERVDVPTLNGTGTERIGLGKDLSSVGIARLEGVRLGTELINFEQAGSKAGKDLMSEQAWKGSVSFDQGNTLAMRDAIKVAKNWMSMVAEKGTNIREEIRAMSQGAFGAPGGAMAEELLSRA